MYLGQNGCQTGAFSSHQEHFFPSEVLKVFSSLLGDSSDGASCFSAICSHCESSLSDAVSLQWGSSQHLLLPWLLTVGWPIVQEVGCHFPFTFDLHHPTTLQHVPFVCKHLGEVCRHLRAGREKPDITRCSFVKILQRNNESCVMQEAQISFQITAQFWRSLI